MKWFKIIGFCWILLVSSVHAETITVATWGGAYEEAQRKALFEPFEQASGIQIKTVLYTGGIDVLRQRKSVPDVIDMVEADARIACEQEALHQLPWQSLMHKNHRYDDIEDDFLEDAFLPCGVAHLTYSTVAAFDINAFSGEKPNRIADFFDIERFPGRRALHKNPEVILEWALMTEKVPISQIYDLLSTDRGMRLAFRRLDQIRDYIVWWDNPADAAEWLKQGKVSMSMGYNGRFFDIQRDVPSVDMIWDGQILDRSVWVLPKQGKPVRPALKQFIQFVTKAEQLARLAEYIPYGPTRKSAFARIGQHPTRGISMKDQLPTTPYHLRRALVRDSYWYAQTDELRQKRFKAWLEAN